MAGFKVLILGGGNCGLAIATGLKKAGIQCTVFERDTEHDFYYKPRDWGMLLHWGMDHLEKLLPDDLKPRLQEIRCDPNLNDSANEGGKVPFVNALDGSLIAEIPMGGVNRVSRKKIRRFLMSRGDLDVQFAKYVDSIQVDDDKCCVSFRDGTTETGSMIIGCDGSHSKVREYLVGTEAAKLQSVDLTMINFPLGGYTTTEARLLQTRHPVFKIASHPDLPGNAILAALDIADPADPTTWIFQNYIGWWGPPYAADLQDMEKRVSFYRSFIEPFCEPFRTAGLKLPPNGTIPVYPGQQWAPTMDWDNRTGRVTLAGDAAHSMVPQRGQGLNNAMCDAANLVDAIVEAQNGKKTLAEAIAEYEAEMKPRGAREVGLSLEQAMKARNTSTIKDSPIFKLGWQRERRDEVHA
ncbi:putative monooxygenase [Elsinoe ampelina]|uniref:Putative monooxygenase n=1 Tax=Elsinoe ampelina TaxID=302913 RepID=A0A6A6G2F6_9PEZI|nr:putative monooxygenase [Elsinoe ampelina]